MAFALGVGSLAGCMREARTSPRSLSVAAAASGVVTDITGDAVDSEAKHVVWSGLGQAEIQFRPPGR